VGLLDELQPSDDVVERQQLVQLVGQAEMGGQPPVGPPAPRPAEGRRLNAEHG
jgi:hypothetical protein